MPRIFFTLLFIVSFIGIIDAAHIIGGHFEYTCIATSEFENTIKVKLVLIRDAFGGGATFDPDASVGIYYDNGDNTYTTLSSVNNLSPSFVDALDLADYLPFSHFATERLEKGVYEFEVVLPANYDYLIAYQRCCLTDGVTSLLNSGETGIAIQCEIKKEALASCDNSPVFPDLPFLLAPTGVNISHTISAYDSEGDEINMSYAPFYSSGGIEGVSGGNPNSCVGIRPEPLSCLPPYSTVQYTGTASSEFPFAGNAISFVESTYTFNGKATISGKYAYSIKVVQSRDTTVLSVQHLQYTPSFIADLGIGRMIAHPYIDANRNGIREDEEVYFHNIQLAVDNIYDNKVANDGVVTFKVDPGMYNVESHLEEGWEILMPELMNSIAIEEREDIEVYIPIVSTSERSNVIADLHISSMECDGDGQIIVNLENKGTQVEEGEVTIIPSDKLMVLDDGNETYQVNGNTAKFLFSDLKPTEIQQFGILAEMPTTEMKNNPLESQLSITFSENDSDQHFNSVISCDGSPSNLVANVGNEINDTDARIKYLIRFRNDNMSRSFKVKIKQVLSENLDLNSFRIEGASHDYSYDLNRNDLSLTVIMDNVNLASSEKDMVYSVGYVSFSLLPQEDLNKGSIISSQASIYMDNNPPLFTNISEIIFKNQTSSLDLNNSSIYIYPNPFNSSISIKGLESKGLMTLYNVNGQKTLQKEIVNHAVIETAQLLEGIYLFTFIQEDGAIFSKKLVKH